MVSSTITQIISMFKRKTLSLFLSAILVWSGLSFAQQKEQRVALVIGNGAYKASPLRNPVNDARDMAAKLRSLGFTVVERSNLGMKQIGSTLREFRSKLTPGSVALVFYAGHGLQIKGENFLPAVDAEIGGEEDVPNQSMSMRQIMNVLSDAKTRLNLVFMDACRDNPYARSFRTSSGGLAKEEAPSGTLISFATRPGSVASDGNGRNGLYTGALLEQMNNTSLPIEQVLKAVVTSVKGGSNGRQEPWMEGSIEGDFCFGDCFEKLAPPVAMSDDRALWESVKDSRDMNELKVYLNKFPNGLFSELANTRMKSLSLGDANTVVINKPTNIQNSVLHSTATQENILNNPLKLRYIFVSEDTVRKTLNLGDSSDDKKKITKSIKDFCEKFVIQICLTEAVYTKSIFNLSSLVADSILGKNISILDFSKVPNIEDLKIGYVNTDKVLKEALIAKKAQNRLASEFSAREKYLIDIGNKLKAAASKLEADTKILSQTSHEETQRELLLEDLDFQRKRKQFQDDLAKRKNEELKEVLSTVNSILKKIAINDNFDLIVQEVDFKHSKYDITTKLIADLNSSSN